ncbi:MAG TPA: multicopper oxidase domain-containing protein [Bryobacteraceae bacterium]|jgi:spore coat protein A
MMTRRALLLSSVGLPALAAPRTVPPRALLNPDGLAKFVDPLFLLPRAVSRGKSTDYRLTMRELETHFHRDLPPARVWGFETSSPGPTIEVRRGEPVRVEWINALPSRHLFTVDHSLHGAERNLPEVRTVVHVHGARVPPASDGYPENWFTAGQSRTSLYPNEQEAAALWYHDHAMSITRLNLYAGLFGFYIVRDEVEDTLRLPSGDYEIPLMLFDRSFSAGGQLEYPVSADPDHPWVAEFAGEAILANGRLYPYLDVEPCTYRFRIANVSNSRFLNLSLSNRQVIQQIGCDQGLLGAPEALELLTLAPAERADILIDFSANAGGTIVLVSDTLPILQFRVRNKSRAAAFAAPRRLRVLVPLEERASVRTRALTLDGPDDADDEAGMPMIMTLNGSGWHDPVTEKPVIDTVEIWSLINLTEDTHPIHLHLVQFQILDRRAFDLFTYRMENKLLYTGGAAPPEPNEAGWKDTVRAEPGMVTRIIVKFSGYTGRYVWHCHILEHEDNDMMRPYDIVPAQPTNGR